MAATTITDREQVVRDMQRLAQRLERTRAKLDALLAERDAVYVKGRTLDPPLTYKLMAETFGVTEGAVHQKVKEAEQRANGATKPARPRTREERLRAAAGGTS